MRHLVGVATSVMLAWGPALPDLGAPNAALAGLFTPLSVPPGTYTVSTTPQPIAVVAAALKACDPIPTPGAWTLTTPEAHDAFGQAGVYDRSRLAQLFGGRRPTVARGALVRDGTREAYTLISPYPDAALSRLESGTMVVVLRMTPLP
jgi:hypothetical protein